MSIPISWCLIQKAAKGNEDSYQEYVKRMKVNMAFGSHSIFPCYHDPVCEMASKEEIDKLNMRLKTEDWPKDTTPKGPLGIPGRADQ